MVGQFKKAYLHSHTRENSKMFNTTLKYFRFFNNKPPASRVAHITRDFLTCYSCSYYNSMLLLSIANVLEKHSQIAIIRSSHSKMFFKIGVLKNCAIFTGKHLYCSLCNFIMKKLQRRYFPVNIAKFFTTAFI